jgi:hypothetical protein
MGSYILSDANRFYLATENRYGLPAPVDASNRFAAFGFDCHQTVAAVTRRDKTGSRTYLGGFPGVTRSSSFSISGHLTSWDSSTQPGCGPLVQAAMGATPELVQGLVVAAVNGAQIQTQVAHALSIGSAVSNGAEIRFVSAVTDSLTFSVNVPFSSGPGVGAALATTAGFRLGTQLPSVSIYDYWDPPASVSRLVTGAMVNKFQIDVSGEVHELAFSGPAADVLDSSSGVFGVSGLAAFLSEPAAAAFEYSIVDGQLGQAWLGAPLNQVFALTEASVEINNNLLVRNQDFGSSYPTAVIPGPRQVVSSFTLFAQSDIATQSLYAAAKAKTPISALLQLGQRSGQMMAVYLPNVIAELPLFQDSEPYLLWEFKNNLGQGVTNDEVFIGFA